MDLNTESSETSPSVVSSSVVEAVVAFIILVAGIVVVYSSIKLGASWTSDGPGAGYFPFYIGLMLCVSGAATLLKELFGKNKNTDSFVDQAQLKRVLSVLLPAVIYVMAIHFSGIYVASTIYIALFMVILGKYSWLKSVFAALAVIVVFFFMFEVWFQVPLYKGIYEPLSFLGY